MENDTLAITDADFERMGVLLDELRTFEKKALDRFQVYAPAHLGFDPEKRVKQGGGFVSYRVSLSKSDIEKGQIRVIENTANDRGPGSTQTFTMDREALAGVTEREQDMAQYLALKEKLGE